MALDPPREGMRVLQGLFFVCPSWLLGGFARVLVIPGVSIGFVGLRRLRILQGVLLGFCKGVLQRGSYK